MSKVKAEKFTGLASEIAQNANFKKDIERAINCNSIENYFDIPDFLLAEMIAGFLVSVSAGLNASRQWHGFQSIYKEPNPTKDEQ